MGIISCDNLKLTDVLMVLKTFIHEFCSLTLTQGKNQPIRTLDSVITVFLLDNFGVGVWNSYLKSFMARSVMTLNNENINVSMQWYSFLVINTKKNYNTITWKT